MSENENKVKEAKRRLNITLSSFTMFATPRTRKDRKQIRLTYGCTNGYPNVNIETDEDGEPTLENGFLRLSSRLNSPNFFAFLNLIEKALEESPGWSRGIECYHTYKDGEVLEVPQKINDLKVGVDNQGLVYLTILQPGRTSAKFTFGPTEWHNYKDQDGNALSQKEQNHICAKAAVDGLRVAMGSAIALDSLDILVGNAGLPSPSKKPEANTQQSGFQKTSYNGGQNNQGGFQKKPWNNNGGQQGGYNNNNGYQKKPWNNNGGGGNGGGSGYNQGGYQKKPWNNNGGQQSNYQKPSYNGGQNNQGGFQKKPWENKQQDSQPSTDMLEDEIDF